MDEGGTAFPGIGLALFLAWRRARNAMELLFRKYFWSVHLLFIMLVAFLAARTVNVLRSLR